jgi:hypothetical protein
LEALTADPSLKSGMFFIDPDGHGMGDEPIYVYCNMTKGKFLKKESRRSFIFF